MQSDPCLLPSPVLGTEEAPRPIKVVCTEPDRHSVTTNGHIEYDAFRMALQDVRQRGIAPRICLPFAARSGQVVNIGGEEYRLQARVTHEGELAGITADDAQVAGYRVTRA